MSIKIELYFDDIDCSSCAKKIEERINKLDFIISSRISLISKKIIIESIDDKSIDQVIKQIECIARTIEPDIKISNVPFNNSKQEETINCCCGHSHESCSHEHNDHCEHGHIHEHGHLHEHGHNHKHKCPHDHDHLEYKDNSIEKHNYKFNVLFIISTLLFILCIIFDKIIRINGTEIIVRIIYVISYCLLAYKILIKSVKGIMHKNVFNEYFLMALASIIALIINENIEAILVICLYNIGSYFEKLATTKSTDAISSLINLKVNKTSLEDGTLVDTKDVCVGTIIIVRNGERVPLDGILIDGDATIDMQTLTGESCLVDIKEGVEVLSGSINKGSVMKIKVTKEEESSTLSKMIKMVEEAGLKKSNTEEFITKFSRIYTPIVISCALLVFLVECFVFKDYFSVNDAINNSCVFLVSSCPCALIISIPLSFYSGIGKCSKYGILVKGGNFLEVMSKVNTICFDKTGTLTKGNFEVIDIKTYNNTSKEELLDYVVSIEKYSTHPISNAFIDYNKQYNITNVLEIKGKGLYGLIDDKVLLVGNKQLLESYNVDFIEEELPGTILYVALNNKYIGLILIGDEIKPTAKDLIKTLQNKNIKPIIISGDKKQIVSSIANSLNINDYYYEKLPEEKLETLEEVINESSLVAYVGDGINDTPSLKLASCGISISGIGKDEACASSDVVLLKDDLMSIDLLITISKYTKKILNENIIFAIGVKLIALVIGMIGLLGSYGMLLGVFADVGVCIIVVLNTFRILRWRK